MPPISSVSQQISNLGQNAGPSIEDSQLFGRALTDLLKSYQQIEKYPFVGQQISGQEEQAKRLSFTSPNLIGAAPGVQSAARSASASAVQPTISGAAQSQQTFGSRLETFADVLSQGRAIQAQAEASALQQKADTQALIQNAIASFGPDAFAGTDPKQIASLEKLAGVGTGYVTSVSKAIKAREAAVKADELAKEERQFNYEARLRSISSGGGGGGGGGMSISDLVNLQKNPLIKMKLAGYVRAPAPGGGKGFWFYDPDGNPVKVAEVATAIGATPAELLAGSTNPTDRKLIQESSAKPLSAEAQKFKINGISGSNSLGIIENLLKQGISKSELGAAKSGFTSILASGKAKQYRDAARNVADVIARLRTGAAINKQEIGLYLQFLPGPTDDGKTIRQKLNNLHIIFDNALTGTMTSDLIESQFGGDGQSYDDVAGQYRGVPL